MQKQDAVVKFLLKLRNNNLNNLKNALRKVGERTHGKKDELLLRLANKLATEEGRQLVQANFKPEIYTDLYEVEIYGNQQQNTNNPIYQHYRGLIPPETPTPVAYPPQVPTSTAPPIQHSRNIMSQAPPAPPSNIKASPVQQLPPNKPPAAAPVQSGAVIDLLDSEGDEPEIAKPKVAAKQVNKSPLIPKPTLQQPQTVVQDIPISSMSTADPLQIPISQLGTKTHLPMDSDQPPAIVCHCASPNSQFVPNTNQQSKHQLIQCSACGLQMHLSCQEKNKSMQKSNLDMQRQFTCATCQFRLMDPLAVPMMTLKQPTILPKLTAQEARQKKVPVTIDFSVPERVYSLINKAGNYGTQKPLKVQIRCIRLDAIGFEHTWPKFGGIKVGQGAVSEWKIPPPPNDQKKRKDEMLDITTQVKRGRNTIDVWQEQKDHAGFFQHPGHVIAIYLVRQIPPATYLEHMKATANEEFKTGLTRSLKFFNPSLHTEEEELTIQEDAMGVQSTSMVLLNSQCPITMCTISLPARGEHCTHLQCFDLASYIEINSKHRRWLCPICNRRSLMCKRDIWFQQVVEQVQVQCDNDYKLEDKFYMESVPATNGGSGLEIKMLKERGKWQSRFDVKVDLAAEKIELKLLEDGIQASASPGKQSTCASPGDNTPEPGDLLGKRPACEDLDQQSQQQPGGQKRQKTTGVAAPAQMISNRNDPVEID